MYRFAFGVGAGVGRYSESSFAQSDLDDATRLGVDEIGELSKLVEAGAMTEVQMQQLTAAFREGEISIGDIAKEAGADLTPLQTGDYITSRFPGEFVYRGTKIGQVPRIRERVAELAKTSSDKQIYEKLVEEKLINPSDAKEKIDYIKNNCVKKKQKNVEIVENEPEKRKPYKKQKPKKISKSNNKINTQQ